MESGRVNLGAARGFTLIELIVVLIVLGTVALLVFPRISSFSAGEARRSLRHLTALIQHLTQESAARKETYRLYINLDSDEYWTARVQGSGEIVTTAAMTKRYPLPSELTFESVTTAEQGKVTDGEVFSEFYPVGIEKLVIHFRQKTKREIEDEPYVTLLANPLTGRVKIIDRYVEAQPVAHDVEE